MTTKEKQLPATQADNAELGAIAKLIMKGDLSGLTDDQKCQVYLKRCEAAGLSPESQPYEYIEFKGKVSLYLRAVGLNELSKKNKVSHVILEEKEILDGQAYKVTVKAFTPEGREETASKWNPLYTPKGSWVTGKFVFENNEDGTPKMVPISLVDKLLIYQKTETSARNRATRALVGESAPEDDDLNIEEIPALTKKDTNHIVTEKAKEIAAAAVKALPGTETVDVATETEPQAEPTPTHGERLEAAAMLAEAQGNTQVAESLKAAAKGISNTQATALIKAGGGSGWKIPDILKVLTSEPYSLDKNSWQKEITERQYNEVFDHVQNNKPEMAAVPA